MSQHDSQTTELPPCECCHKRPRMDRIFLVCEECWNECHKDDAPPMSNSDTTICDCRQPGLGGDCDGSCQHPPPDRQTTVPSGLIDGLMAAATNLGLWHAAQAAWAWAGMFDAKGERNVAAAFRQFAQSLEEQSGR